MAQRGEEQVKRRSSYWLYCGGTCFQPPPSTQELEPEGKQLAYPKSPHQDVIKIQVKKAGWRAMPFILGNETFERLATFGMSANFMVYLMTVYRMEQVAAVNVLNVWGGITNFAPIVGAFVSDAYVGRFRTIAFSSCAAFLGMVTLTLTSWLPHLHPLKCQEEDDHCAGPTSLQLALLFLGLGFLSVGTGGIRPCSIPFGVDQFDPTTDEGKTGITSFYNWYYLTFTAVIMVTLTFIIYIQQYVSWTLGFGIPTLCMFFSIVLFFIGTKLYVYVKPEGSIFSGIARVFAAAFTKRRLEFTGSEAGVDPEFYDPPLEGSNVETMLSLTNQYRYLNKAALITKDDLKSDGTLANPWRLTSIQQVEEVKCLMKIVPVWTSGIISLTAMTQQMTFTVSQAMTMNLRLTPHFEMPTASIIVVSMITIGVWLPIYDRILVPSLRRITGIPSGITMLQRMGIGILFSIASMVVAGLVEKARRDFAFSHPKTTPMSIFWLSPQLALMGMCEAFNVVGQIEFYNREFPEHMTSVASALFFCSFGGANYISSLLVVIVHGTTGNSHHPNWLADDLNQGRLDYFYYLLAVLGALNGVYFLYCSSRYRYKGSGDKGEAPGKTFVDVELSSKNIVS